MDLLANAYSTDSADDDNDEDGVPESKPERRRPVLMHQPKRHRSGNPSYHNEPLPVLHRPNPASTTEILVTSRYVSKRERALALSSAPRVRDPDPLTPVTTTPVVGSISNSKLPHNILASLKRQKTGRTMPNQISERPSVALSGHSKAVNVVQWSTTHAHLLASAGMDGTICIWNAWSIDQKKARVLNYHNAAVKDVKWSQQGLFVLSCGYDCTSRLIDIESGLETQVFKEDQVVGVIKFHPDNSNLFLSGGLLGSLRLWDIRVGKVVHEYIRDLGPILDIEFTLDAKQFISSSDVSKGNISENSIIIWDISRQVPLSNQVYVEAYTCPCIRHHPLDPYFVAQSNGNYIAIFSSKPPFKLDKYKRYESHSVSGFPTKCNFSMDGEKLVSGSSDGCFYFYNSRSTELIKKIKAYEQACIDIAFHPIMPNVIASCSWSGDVSVFE